jgi:hypothetical protein
VKLALIWASGVARRTLDSDAKAEVDTEQNGFRESERGYLSKVLVKIHTGRSECKRTQHGSTILIVAASLIVILLLAGLAIDLVAFYLGRSEAQRAADAGALAGAQQFVSSGFLTGAVTQGTVTTLATNASTAAAEQNKVGGQTLTAANITVPSPDFSRAGNPLITVQVSRSLPTFFMNIFGVSTVTVATSATAEAYDPGGATGGPTFCATCLKPFLVPNCDPVHTAPANSACPGGGSYGYFINSNGSAANPGVYPTGVVGESWQLHSEAAPSQWFELSFDGSQSKSSFENAVESCSASVITCGTQIDTMDGKAVGPNGHSVGCLITYGATCKSQSVTSTDSITVNTGSSPPYTITAGSGNPFFASGTTIAQSASLITVPVYDGHKLTPGGSTVTVVGYMQVFIQDIQHSGKSDNIDVIVLNTSSCGTTGGASCGTTGGGNTGGSGTVSGGGASFVPVRLIQHP